MRIIYYKKLQIFLLLSTLFFSLVINQQVIANEARLNNQGDLLYDLQLVDPILLAEDVKNIKASLVKQQSKLRDIVVNKKISTSEVVMSLILPGGMLYGSYRIYEQEKAKKSLLTTTNDINDLSNDLIALSSEVSNHSNIRVASLVSKSNFNL